MRTACVVGLAASLVMLPLVAADRQFYSNLDFETSTRGQAWSWPEYGPGYEFAMDTSVFVSGAQSLRIRNLNAPLLTANTGQAFPPEIARGHHMRFSGYIKTDNITKANAGLWLRVDGSAGMISIDNAPPAGPNGTKDWQQFVIERDVSPDAQAIYFGMFHAGDGTAWFDNLAIEIDGVSYGRGPAPNIGPPTDAQLNWLQQNANPFWSADPTGSLDDLWPVMGIVGDAHLVGLGEGTHGTSEFFRMKHRLLEYLVTRMGFTVFAIEANMPEAYKVNDYVLNGVGDPRKLLQGMYFWTWNTQEVLDMILWMRQFNLSGKGRVQFTGVDMQYGSIAMANVGNFVTRAEPGYLAQLNMAYTAALAVQTKWQQGVQQSTTAVSAAVDGVRAVWQHLEQHRADYLSSIPAEDIDWAIQNGKVVEQATYIAIGGSSYRDQCMAANMDWILQHNPPGTKAVLWAHDYHVSRATGAMGSYLAANHGADYLVVGQIFHAGRYNAINSGRLMANDATASFEGTIEYALHATSVPSLLLDLRKASPDDPGSSWLFGTTQYRNIGALVTDGFQFTNQFTKDYDVIVFFDQTNPSALLPFN